MQEAVRVLFGERGQSVGTLAFDSDRPESSRFAYDDGWLARGPGFSVSPDLRLVSGWQYVSKSGRAGPFPLAMADTAPGAWGRTLILRSFRKGNINGGRNLSELDFLLGVDDESRAGALRFAVDRRLGEKAVERRRTPVFLDLASIYQACRRVELAEETREDLLYLEGRGTSLGGARPKCTVLDEQGRLCLGKFPSAGDRRAVTKGEILALLLARRAGIDAAEGRVAVIDGVPVALIRRFDRKDGGRLMYWSMATLLQKSPRDFPPPSYAELLEALLVMGSAPGEAAACEMLRRIFFSYLVNNTDDHARNTGALMLGDGNWTLAPAFDINPEPMRGFADPYASKTFLTPASGPVTDLGMVFGELDAFGLSPRQGAACLKGVLAALRGWRAAARSPAVGMTDAEARGFASAFEHGRRDEAEALAARFGA
ncbi:MAG: type II toxin-antitoxin system HipA family toxin [Duodenibacillus sp.]|nr:type II toxin-antitoxin system HipA family toxin [Duodenibacillus sp.]